MERHPKCNPISLPLNLVLCFLIGAIGISSAFAIDVQRVEPKLPDNLRSALEKVDFAGSVANSRFAYRSNNFRSIKSGRDKIGNPSRLLFATEPCSAFDAEDDVEKNWKKIEFGDRFTILLPEDVEEIETHGIDSKLFRWQGENIEVLVDLGLFGDPVTSKSEVSIIRVSDREARFRSETTTDGQVRFVVHVPAINFGSKSNQKLTLSITCSSQRAHEDAQRIIDSLQIREIE